ncbi:MAG: ADP-forming succinate--CoA ligase subunit beta [Candidatus Thermoplasmatota archaeon]|jgi:succinyl-CoA synthetase beta subunit|nr:ADP-forming succinate--CoA ligase subunit beta [Candidatus Thermoplasmatota archaeon]
MNLYEYQAKDLFKKYGIPIPSGKFVASESDLESDRFPVVVKAQVLTGGRGKAGGIKFANNREELKQKGREILAMTIKGLKVRSLLLEEKLDISKEYYLSITLDRSSRAPVIIASTSGGVEIEDVPDEKIVKYLIDPTVGYSQFVAREMSFRLGLGPEESKQFGDILSKLFGLYEGYDCELVEINPLTVLKDGRILAGDAKVIVDSDSLFRHKDLSENPAERTELEEMAYKRGYALVELGGDIGVIANGAGLTMATLDGLTLMGLKPKNFLDLGGSDDVEKVVGAFQILKEASIRAILINIFGGVTHCDTVANGIAEAKKRVGIHVPIVVRLSGVNEDLGRKILKENGIESYSDMMDAIKEIVKVVK